jgi:hypothetical protein
MIRIRRDRLRLKTLQHASTGGSEFLAPSL